MKAIILNSITGKVTEATSTDSHPAASGTLVWQDPKGICLGEVAHPNDILQILRIDTPDFLAFGEAVASIRTALNLNTNQIAKKAGVIPNQIARIEQGQHNPNLLTMLRVLDALGYDLAIVPK
ncbi:MAG: helix-turn-helix transcriptional regulator [Muribaculaceae bacterium]|nr:helix-turn-helix transcriptional regulator [Muribaculaceae bacterium]